MDVELCQSYAWRCTAHVRRPRHIMAERWDPTAYCKYPFPSSHCCYTCFHIPGLSTRRLIHTYTHPCQSRHASLRRGRCALPVRMMMIYNCSEFGEPQGWYHFVLSDVPDRLCEEEAAAGHNSRQQSLTAIEVFVLQICVLGNHLNGKDTHIRCMKVFGPPAPGFQRRASWRKKPQAAATNWLVKQGMQTEAFHRQVERVGHEHAVLQLERIMQRRTRSSLDSTETSTSVQPSVQRSLLTLSQTLR